MSSQQIPPSALDSQIIKSWLFTQNPDGSLSPADLSKSNIFINGALPSFGNPLAVELSDGTQAVGTSSNPLGVNLAKVGGSAVSLGAKASASSIPVVLATDEAALPVTLTSTTVTNTLAENLTQVAGNAVATAASGTQKVGVVGGSGSTLDSAAGVSNTQALTIQGNASGVAVPENLTLVNSQSVAVAAAGVQKVGIVGASATSFETTSGVLDTNIKNIGNAALSLGAKTSANSIPVVLASDEANVPIIGAQGAISTTTWTSATPGSTSLQINCSGYGSVVLFFTTTGGTFTAGTLRFLASITGGNSCDVTGTRFANTSTPQMYDASNTYNLAPSVSWMYVFPVSGFDLFTVLLSNAIIGTGSITLELRATAQLVPGPTTVGQSDASKLNATILGSFSSSSVTWSSATADSTFLNIPCSGIAAVGLSITTNSGTFSTGSLFFRGITPSGAYASLTGMRQSVFTAQLYDANHTLTLAPSQTFTYWFNVSGLSTLGVELAAITGTGSVTIAYQTSAFPTVGPTTVGQSDPTKLNATVLSTKSATSFTASAPAAGADFSVTFTTAGILQSFHARLVTNSTSASRLPDFVIQDAAGNLLYAIAPFTQTLSTTIDYQLGSGFPFQTVATSGILLVPISPIVVMPNWTLHSNTFALQAGDQWSGLTWSLQTS